MTTVAAQEGWLNGYAIALPGLRVGGAVADATEDLWGHERACCFQKQIGE